MLMDAFVVRLCRDMSLATAPQASNLHLVWVG